jgi:hypothetical protein
MKNLGSKYCLHNIPDHNSYDFIFIPVSTFVQPFTLFEIYLLLFKILWFQITERNN